MQNKFLLIKRDLKKNYSLYLLILPVLLFYFAFCYKPMYGVVIAFQNYNPAFGIMESNWVGFKHFVDFFKSEYFGRILFNTLNISFQSLIFGFPIPIILALLINELKSPKFAKTVQTISYLPHFISIVVICGMIKEFTMDTGLINNIIAFFGGNRQTLLNDKNMFVPIYIISDIWQSVGWNSIVYLAALSAIDVQLYEAATIDGAGRFRQTLHITLPGILPTVFVLLILRVGNMLNVGFEKIILLYNPITYATADVISTYVYRKGLQEFNWSFSTAVGLFNAVVSFLLLIISNTLSKKYNETSLW